MRTFDILVVGELNPDLILYDPDLEPRFGQQETLVENMDLTIGSSSAIFACGAVRLGMTVAFVGLVGDDLFGNFMVTRLEQRGVDTSNVIVDASSRTGLGVILNRGADRAILTYSGAIATFRADQISISALNSARHLHVGSYFLQTGLQPGLPDLFRTARNVGMTTSLDTNWDPAAQWSQVTELLNFTDIFFPNEAEAKVLTGASTIQATLEILSRLVPIVAIKRGAQGAIAQQGKEVASIPAFPMDIVDTIGAGDSFDAGFITAHLQGWPLKRCLELAVACGSLSTRSHGGTAAQPTLEEALTVISPR